jgi:flagellar motor switch/type III secretory pathway protein FliN
MNLEQKISELGSSITVKIADKNISLSEFRDYAIGTSIDFNKSLDSEVELMLHNKAYGKAKLMVKDNMLCLKITKIY